MNKTILITGASRGIGKAIALKLSEGPYNIIINYRQKKDEAEEVVQEILGRKKDCIKIQADISSWDAVQEMYNQAIKRFGHIDVLINNAGISSYNLLQDIEPEVWQETFAVNVHGAFYCTKLVLPGMISRQQGKIINISSMWGSVGSSCESLYASTKGAVDTFTKALAKEVAPSNINVNGVAPGAIQTDMLCQLDNEILEDIRQEIPLHRLGSVEDVANIVDYLVSPLGDFITGQIISPNGGMVI